MAFGDVVQALSATGVAPTLTVVAPTNGNLQIVAFSVTAVAGSNVTGITQTGATWVKAGEQVNSGGAVLEVWYNLNPSSGGATITPAYSGSPVATALYYEISGSCSALDKTAGANVDNGGGFPATGTTATTTQGNEFLVAFFALDTNKGLSTPTNSFVIRNDITPVPHIGMASLVVSSKGAYTTAMTAWTGGTPLTFHSANMMFTFKKTGGDFVYQGWP